MKQERNWEYLNQLGREYIAEVERGYGTTPEDRSPRQVAIGKEIVEKSLGYFYLLAKQLQGKGVGLKTPTGTQVVTARNKQFSIDDLVRYGVQSVLEELDNYNPQFAISSFIKYSAVFGMVNASIEEGLFHIPHNKYYKAKRIVREGGYSREEAISRLMNEVILDDGCETRKTKEDDAYFMAMAIYSSLREGWLSIHRRFRESSSNPSNSKFEDRFLPDKETPTPEEKIILKELGELMVNCMEKALTPMDLRVLGWRFGLVMPDGRPSFEEMIASWRSGLAEEQETLTLKEIGDKYYLSRERIRQIEENALYKCRTMIKASFSSYEKDHVAPEAYHFLFRTVADMEIERKRKEKKKEEKLRMHFLFRDGN